MARRSVLRQIFSRRLGFCLNGVISAIRNNIYFLKNLKRVWVWGGVRTCLSLSVCLCMCECILLFVKARGQCHSSEVIQFTCFLLLCGTGSLPCLELSSSLSGFARRPRDTPLSASLALPRDHKPTTPSLSSLRWVVRIKMLSSCLQDRHFTNGA